ncbi:up-regulator of cell proliferation-like [Ascaphus truei]|uniref:up-regulator of cell proliferation-like n=1 Tax=Ascaphus truei TaxID=8439 RepID=UPI003F59C0F3
MAGARGVLEVLQTVQDNLMVRTDVEGLPEELELMLHVTLEEDHTTLKDIDHPIDKMEELINILLSNGEAVCQKFLTHLETQADRFPRLIQLSGVRDKRRKFEKLLIYLKMESHLHVKLTLKNVLDIGPETLWKASAHTAEDVPWRFLRKLMALNGEARNTIYGHSTLNLETSINGPEQDVEENVDFGYETDTLICTHPLDVLCALLHCSDRFLQQEIVSKMSMCQFAVPLLLPAGDGPDCTFMLWAMRDIVKRWRPQSLAERKGCKEDSLVHIPMPTFSFVRLGKCSLSKSNILNQALSPAQQHHDFFVHRNMEGGNVPRKISDGLVEISWYFPGGGKEKSDIFPEPIAVTNLRGDLESNWKQFRFLTRVSSAVFIFAESINQRQYTLLLDIENSETKYYFIMRPIDGNSVSKETEESLRKLYPLLKIGRRNVLIHGGTCKDAELVKKLQACISHSIRNTSNQGALADMAKTAAELTMQVDEHGEECRSARERARDITEEIADLEQFKKETMRLQGDLWKQLSQVEKELCRMEKKGDVNAEEYKSQLIKRRFDLRREQNQQDLPGGMKKFIAAFVTLSQVEKRYFLKWMHFELNSVARGYLSVLRCEYKQKILSSMAELKRLDQRMSDSSLGVEHFLRELGQIYEAECFMVREGEMTTNQRKCVALPGAAADLLLDGFPLELIDGDASNIPLRWVTDVLTELDNKTRGRCRMRVITVLGVQSTGKSTLLNTMFGLQFPVASGRCTRGAFMTIIKVKDNFQEELACDFILVIDTEGLKAPELASLGDSYEHDNELATLVVGLSDITIVNMAMENTAEMKDILQIVVHAFLRMKEIGKKPNCQFVHQNVSDVSAHDKNTRDRKNVLEHLNKMMKAAATMEKINKVMFCDVLEYDLENHNWYIPGLWHGVPPMALINSGYAEKTAELKEYLLTFMKQQACLSSCQHVSELIEGVKCLWNAIKHEKYIFSFMNSLEAEAYTDLAKQFSELEWNLRKKMHDWSTVKVNLIQNQTADELGRNNLTDEILQLLGKEERNMEELLKKNFENELEGVCLTKGNLIEKYKEEILRSVQCLRNELESYLDSKCADAIEIQKEKYRMEEKVSSLLEDFRRKPCEPNETELNVEFENMWNDLLAQLQPKDLKERNIEQDVLQELRREMRSKGSFINEKLIRITSLSDYRHRPFTIDKTYIDFSWYSIEGGREIYGHKCWSKMYRLATSLLDTCVTYAKDCKDYDNIYCRELLNMINERLRQEDFRILQWTDFFEVDLKLHILARVAPLFQKMHEDSVQEKDLRLGLEKGRPQCLAIFRSIVQEKERAKLFCDLCLKPALAQHINNTLGKEIVSDILNSTNTVEYTSQQFLKFSVLQDLLEKKSFSQYVEYINKYENFVTNWMLKHMHNKYNKGTDLETLQSNVLFSMTKKVREVLNDSKVLESPNVPTLVANCCEILNNELVISQQDLKRIDLESTSTVCQFLADINFFVTEMERQFESEMKSRSIESVLSEVALKPEDELFKVFGCGKQCPFCKVPCEVGGADHKEHFASVHRPRGLGQYTHLNRVLDHSICSSDVISTKDLSSSDSYKDWTIQIDPSISASAYWKFIFNAFNEQFAEEYKAEAADLPESWLHITKEQALKSLEQTFNVSASFTEQTCNTRPCK